ncbi:MAG: hypothetical protein IT239_02195 [Bacteroidia bacterium]|nr:hypothetical protein [Bacteroidia bacterium]
MIHYSNQQIWKELEAHLKQVNNNFLNRLSQKFPLLTGNEKKICGYLVLHLSTKDVASITNQTVRSIEIARTRLREKLGLKGSTEDISQFLNNI